MEEHNKEHEEVIQGVKEQFQEILDNSSQAMYAYLDDSHKLCNSKFASLLGYASPEEWAEVTDSFPNAFVQEDSHNELIGAYQKAMEEHAGSKVIVAWKKKNGEQANTEVILVPIAFNNEVLALHFINEIA